MKKILPVAIIVGVLSLVACSALGSCSVEDNPTRVLDGPALKNAVKHEAYNHNPNALGVFDLVDYTNEEISLQTAYLDLHYINRSEWAIDGTGSNTIRFKYVHSGFNRVTTWNGLTSARGFGAMNRGEWVFGSGIPTSSDDVFGLFFADGSGLTIGLPSSWLSTQDVAGFANWLEDNPLHIQYARTEIDRISFAEFFALDDVAHCPITIHVDSVLPASMAILELYYDTESTYPDVFIPAGSSFTLPESYFVIGAEFYDFWVGSDDLFMTFDLETSYGGNFPPVYPIGYSSDNRCYLPYWEGPIDIYVTIRGRSGHQAYNNTSATFEIDTINPSFVNCGATYTRAYYVGEDAGKAWASDYADQGREEGYSEGYSIGYGNGYDSGYRVGYVEGENAVSDGGLVVSNLFGAIAGVPISILNGLSDLTIWSIPLISILMSFMFLGIVLWIVKKFI